MMIWIARRGELNEGGHILGVYATRDGAVQRALSEECHAEGGWMPGILHHWWDGNCDWVSAEPWEVQK